MPRIPFELGPLQSDQESPVGFRPARRSLIALLMMALGYLISRDLVVLPSLWLSAAGIFAAASLLTRRWACRVVLAGAVFCFAAGWFSWRVHQARAAIEQEFATIAGPPGDVPLWIAPVLVRAQGVVVDSPDETTFPQGALTSFFQVTRAATFTLKLESLTGPAGSIETRRTIRVSMPIDDSRHAAISLRAGDVVRLAGHLTLDGPPLNPGEPDRRLLSSQRGVMGRLRVPSGALIEHVQPMTGYAQFESRLMRLVGSARDRARRSLDAMIGDEPSERSSETTVPAGSDHARAGRALLAAMLMGEREAGYDEADRAFRRLGLVHLVAISGFNLAVLAGLALFLVRLTGDRGRLEPLIAAVVVTLYMIVVPAEAPILRSGITLLVFLLTEAIGARYDRLTLLGWTAIGLLMWRPMDLWSLGFQLSFGIVAVLLWLGERTNGRLFGVRLRGTFETRRYGFRALRRDTLALAGEHVRTLISSSLLAWCIAMPVVAHHTGVVSPLAVLTTMIVLPLTVVVLWAGYIALAVGVVWPDAGEQLGGVMRTLGDFLAWVVMMIDDVPGMSVTAPWMSAAWAAVATACMVAWFRWWRLRHRLPLLATTLVIIWLGIELMHSTRLPRDVRLRLDTMAVGDATCHLVRSGDDAMLWDGGASSPGFGLTALPRLVRELGGGRVRTAVVTHANLDHFGALVDAAPRLGIERVIVCGPFLEMARSRPDSAAGMMVELLTAQGVRIETAADGDELRFGDVTLQFLSPVKGGTFKNVNDTSLVGVFAVATEGGVRRVMMTGDIGPEGMRALRERHRSLGADVLEVPHHGSFNHEASALVQALDPAIVLQSTGRMRVNDPRWTHARAGRTWHCTAVDGLVTTVIRSDGTIASEVWVDERRVAMFDRSTEVHE